MISNTFVNVSAMGITALLKFFLISIVVNKLSLEDYGLYLIFLLFTYRGMAGFFLFGLPVFVTKLVAENKIARYVINTSLIISFIVAIIIVILWLAFGKYVESTLLTRGMQILLVGSLLFQYPLMIFKAAIEGMQKFKLLRTIEVLSAAISFVFTVVWLGFFKDIQVLMYVFFASMLFEFLLLFYYLYFVKKVIDKRKTNVRIFLIKKQLFLHFSFVKIFGFLSNQGDRVIIALFLTPAALAIYDIVTRVPYLLKNTFSQINIALLPLISSKYRTDKNKMSFYYERGLDLLIYITFPIISILIVNSENILSIWISDDMALYGGLMALYFVWNYINPPYTFGWVFLNATEKKLDKLTRVSFITSIVRLSLLTMFIAPFGVYGIAYASIISLGASMFYVSSLYARVFELSLLKLTANVIVKLLMSISISYVIYRILSTFSTNAFFLFFTHSVISAFIIWGVLYKFSLLDSNKKIIDKYLRRIVR